MGKQGVYINGKQISKNYRDYKQIFTNVAKRGDRIELWHCDRQVNSAIRGADFYQIKELQTGYFTDDRDEVEQWNSVSAEYKTEKGAKDKLALILRHRSDSKSFKIVKIATEEI